MKNKFHCKDCTERHLGCHSVCEDYINARKELDEINAKIFEEKRKYTDYIGFKSYCIRNISKNYSR